MRVHRGLVAAVSVAVLVASACSPSGGSSAPTGASSTGSPGPSSSASASVPVVAFYLRSWNVAPVGPEEVFATAPVVISEGKLLTVKYPEESDTYPLLNPVVSQTISAEGIAKIVAEAQNDGLLGSATTFECPHDASTDPTVGSGTGHLALTVDGVAHEMTASCGFDQPTPGPGAPTPGTWAAFQRFADLLGDPATWLGTDLGPETPYNPDGLLILAMVLPDDAETPTSVVDWPLAPFASFGTPFDESDSRCAVLHGADAATLLAVVTPLTQDAVFGDTGNDQRTLLVRASLPGEPSPCS